MTFGSTLLVVFLRPRDARIPFLDMVGTLSGTLTTKRS